MATRLALLIDADNIAASFAPAVFAYARAKGTPILKRVYGGQAAMSSWAPVIEAECCEGRVQRQLTAAKNGTDIALAVDAMDILALGFNDTFCIVSNDRDFVPLAIRLRMSAVRVLAVCRSSDGRHAGAFDEVHELEPRSPLVAAFRKILPDGERELALAQAGKLLRDHAPGVVPPVGKGLKKALEQTGEFAFTGEGGGVRVRLKG